MLLPCNMHDVMPIIVQIVSTREHPGLPLVGYERTRILGTDGANGAFRTGGGGDAAAAAGSADGSGRDWRSAGDEAVRAPVEYKLQSSAAAASAAAAANACGDSEGDSEAACEPKAPAAGAVPPIQLVHHHDDQQSKQQQQSKQPSKPSSPNSGGPKPNPSGSEQRQSGSSGGSSASAGGSGGGGGSSGSIGGSSSGESLRQAAMDWISATMPTSGSLSPQQLPQFQFTRERGYFMMSTQAQAKLNMFRSVSQ
jgi:hypothetical protein